MTSVKICSVLNSHLLYWGVSLVTIHDLVTLCNHTRYLVQWYSNILTSLTYLSPKTESLKVWLECSAAVSEWFQFHQIGISLKVFWIRSLLTQAPPYCGFIRSFNSIILTTVINRKDILYLITKSLNKYRIYRSCGQDYHYQCSDIVNFIIELIFAVKRILMASLK